jgi:precorrin-2 methylase
VVFLKTYKERPRLIELLRKRALLNSCIYIRRCGLAEEEIVYNMEHLPEEVDYLSMIILKSNDRSS